MEQTSSTTPAFGGNGGTAPSLTEQAKQQTQQAVQQTRQKIGEAADQAKEQMKSQLETQKERAAEGLESVAHVLQQTGEHLRQQNQGKVGDYAETIADQVERWSGMLRGQNVDQILAEAENLARRQPAVFLGGAFALGFLAARFLKSSSPPRYDTGYTGYTGYTAGSEGAVLYPQPAGTEPGTASWSEAR